MPSPEVWCMSSYSASTHDKWGWASSSLCIGKFLLLDYDFLSYIFNSSIDYVTYLFFPIVCVGGPHSLICLCSFPSHQRTMSTTSTTNTKPLGGLLFDPINPYYLKNSDSTTSFPIIDKIKSGNNYYSLSREFKMQIIIKRKLGFIDGSIEMPLDRKSQEFDAWQTNNGSISSCIFGFVTKEITNSIIYNDFSYVKSYN